jgi:hypothetical protein
MTRRTSTSTRRCHNDKQWRLEMPPGFFFPSLLFFYSFNRLLKEYGPRAREVQQRRTRPPSPTPSLYIRHVQTYPLPSTTSNDEENGPKRRVWRKKHVVWANSKYIITVFLLLLLLNNNLRLNYRNTATRTMNGHHRHHGNNG